MILDVRTPEEYGRFCIPGGVSVPGGDLDFVGGRVEAKARYDGGDQLRRADAQHCRHGGACAGLGLTNVRALKNGTMGWVLAGLELETKPAAQHAGRAVR